MYKYIPKTSFHILYTLVGSLTFHLQVMPAVIAVSFGTMPRNCSIYLLAATYGGLQNSIQQETVENNSNKISEKYKSAFKGEDICLPIEKVNTHMLETKF